MGRAWKTLVAWRRRAYLSTFERRLNRALLALFLAALVGGVLQHVVLANVPEVFPKGALWGDLLYDLAIGYAGAFFFYMLIVRVPLRRDRENYYQHLGPLVVGLVAEVKDLMSALNKAADLDPNSPNTLTNIRQLIAALSPEIPADHMLITPEGVPTPGTVLDVIGFHIDRAREASRQLLEFAAYLDSDVVKVVVAMENSLFYFIFDTVEPQLRAKLIKSNQPMAVLADPLFDYLQLADRLNRYRENQENLPDKPEAFPELIAGNHGDSDAIPLSGELPPVAMSVRVGTKTFDSRRSARRD